jgi:hypothetical protein
MSPGREGLDGGDQNVQHPGSAIWPRVRASPGRHSSAASEPYVDLVAFVDQVMADEAGADR